MVSIICLLVFLLTCSPVSSYDAHYMGGSIFYRASINASGYASFDITTLLGWRIGYGPCGKTCGISNIGDQTTLSRNVSRNTTEYYGQWFEESGHTKYDATDEANAITSEVVSLVNQPSSWEQELGTFRITLQKPNPSLSDKLTYRGMYWDHLNYTGTDNVTLSLTVTLNPTVRSDTGSPNSNPMVLFQPLYRIALNKTTRIQLLPYDIDGDLVQCEKRSGVSNVTSYFDQNVKYNTDDSIEIRADESEGFTDGGRGVIHLNMMDYASHPNTPDGGLTPLSSTPVEFMIETVRNLQDPILVSPTMEDGHTFVVYLGSSLEIPLYATPHPSSKFEINSFIVRSLPHANLSVPDPVDYDTRKSERVKKSTFLWTPQKSDIGGYLLGVSVVDSSQRLGTERHFLVVVKDLPSNLLPDQAGPYFVFSPMGSTVECTKDTTCSFPVYATTNNPSHTIVNITSEYSSVKGKTTVSGITSVLHEGIAVSRADISITSSVSGHQIVCFKAMDNNGVSSRTECLDVNVIEPDAKEGDVRLVGGSRTSQGRVEINHNNTWGTLCDYTFDTNAAIVVCHQLGFIGHTSIQTNGALFGSGNGPMWSDDLIRCTGQEKHLMDCHHAQLWGANSNCTSFVGVDCAPLNGTQNATSSSVTTPTPSTCSDVPDVSCETLDATASICALKNDLPTTYCPRYCRLCHDATSTCADSQYVDCGELDRSSTICGSRSPVAVQYCPRYCSYCKAPSTTMPPSTTTVKLTLCNTCDGFDCLFVPKVVACPFNKPLCRTVVTNTPNGATSYTKTCADVTECIQGANPLTPHHTDCDNFDPMRKYYDTFMCSYCCATDNCNGGGAMVPKPDTRLKLNKPDVLG